MGCLETLSESTRRLLVPHEVDAVLDESTERVTAVMGLLGSGVSLLGNGRMESATPGRSSHRRGGAGPTGQPGRGLPPLLTLANQISPQLRW